MLELGAGKSFLIFSISVASYSSPRLRLRSGLSFHGCTFDPDSGRLRTRKGQDVLLTGNEGRLLIHLVQHGGEVQAREQLMNAVLQRAWSPLDRSIDVLITKLRQKVEDDPRHPVIIRTVRGAGYVVPADPRALSNSAA